MRFGSLIAAGYGSPDLHLAVLSAEASGTGAGLLVTAKAASGWGGAWFGVYRNSVRVKSVYLSEGVASEPLAVPSAVPSSDLSLCLLRQGGLGEYDMHRVAMGYEADTSRLVTIDWEWPAEVMGALDSSGEEIDTLSGWSLSGLRYKDHLAPVQGYPTRGTLDLTLTVAAGTATVALSLEGTTLCSGSGAAGGSVTLAEADESGVSGSVDVAAGAVTASGTLYVRFPKSMRVLRGAADPPTVAVAWVPFLGDWESHWTEPSALAGGTYYYRLQPLSDTGDAGTATSTLTAVVPAPPGAPTNLAYASGDAAATVLSFTASATAGATYRAYLREPDQETMDMATPAATAAAGETEITLPAISGYPGTAYVILRAVSGGLEDQNGLLLELEYDAAGAYVPKRPNAATIESVSVSGGLTLSVAAVYATAGEEASPATVRLFARDPDGSYDYDTPADTENLATARAGLRTATLSAALSAGWHYVTVRAATSGGTLSATDAAERLVYVSAAAAAAPTAELRIARR